MAVPGHSGGWLCPAGNALQGGQKTSVRGPGLIPGAAIGLSGFLKGSLGAEERGLIAGKGGRGELSTWCFAAR